MYYSYIDIEYVATSFSPARTDLALKLLKNGCISTKKKHTHIKAKYFFIQHYYQMGESDLCYCHTDNMWVDILTKPLQGSKFHQLQAVLMICPIDYSKDPPMVEYSIINNLLSIFRQSNKPLDCSFTAGVC